MYTFLDLFAGCGGFSVGLKTAGLKSVGEIEIDAWASESLAANFPESRVICEDIKEIDDDAIKSFSGVDVIVGGPPCQGFSVAGASQFGIDDPRNALPFWFLHWVAIVRPRIAIIENVPNILTKSSGGVTIFQAISDEFARIGYKVSHQILNSADFGTPQLRRRAIIVATLPGVKFCFPEPTHCSTAGTNKDIFGDKPPYVTVWEALSDLPQIEAGEGVDNATPYATPALNDYQAKMRKNSSSVTNHVAMKHTSRLIERFKIIGAGQSLKDVPAEYGQLEKLTGQVSKNPFKYNNYRLDPDRPSLAIPASFQSLFLHPKLHRNLTAREAARLMGFPDNFEFKGKRTTMSWEKHLSQYNQIGNSVCPPMAEALGRSIISALNENHATQITPKKYPEPARSTKLSKSEALPAINPINGTDISLELQKIGKSLLKTTETHIRRQGFMIPIEALPVAIIFASTHSCKVCSRSLSPNGNHAGEMPFLISKENIDSLIENSQDHGLDYHLRRTLQIPHQVGHLVGEILSEAGVADIVDVTNNRTGRKVRGMRLTTRNIIPEVVTQRFWAALSIEDLCEAK